VLSGRSLQIVNMLIGKTWKLVTSKRMRVLPKCSLTIAFSW